MKSALSFVAVGSAVAGAFVIGRMTAGKPEPGVEIGISEPATIAAEQPVVSPAPVPGVQLPIQEKPQAGVGQSSIVSLRAAMNEPTAFERRREFAAALENFRPEDGPAGHQLFLDGDAEGRHFFPEWVDFWTRWGELDPEGAYEFITSGALGAPQMRTSTHYSAPFIGHKGKDAARSFLAKLDLDRPSDVGAAAAVIGGLAEVDLDAATEIAISNVDSPFFNDTIEKVAEAAVQSGGLAALMRWYDSLPEGSPIRDAALAPTSRKINRAGSEVAEDWLATLEGG